MDSTRQQKISRMLQKEISSLFQLEGSSFYGNAFVTVTNVRVTPDLGIAYVRLSLFKQKNAEEIVSNLNHKMHDIRRKLGNRIRNQIRHIPELKFFNDESLDYAEHIEKLELELDKLRSKEASATAAAANIEDFRVLKLAELRRETAKVAQVCAEFQYEGIATVLLLIGFSVFLLYHNKRFVSESEVHVETTRKLALLVETSFDDCHRIGLKE